MKTGMLGRWTIAIVWGVAAFLGCLSLGMPAVEDADMIMLEFDEDKLMDTSVVVKTPVPCAFCDQSLTLLLEFCKATHARSTDHVDEFLTRCMEIGGHAPGEMETLAKECSETEKEQKRVNKLYERRLRCTKIFRALVKMYDPYDPCVQVRRDFNNDPMAICRSGNIDCDTPAGGPPKSDFVPPYSTNGSLLYQPPPKTCHHYLNRIINECKEQKSNDFYLRSDLVGWCSETYNGTYQILGCQKVLNETIKRDKHMDLCSGLKIFPIEPKEEPKFCDEFLSMPAFKQVRLAEYDAYLRQVKGFGKMSAYERMVNQTVEVPREPITLP